MRIFKVAVLMAAVMLAPQGYGYDLTHLAGKALADFLPQAERLTNFRTNGAGAMVSMPPSNGNFGGCQENFANGEPPIVPNTKERLARALCFNGFAVLHSGRSKTPIYSAEVLSRARIQRAKGQQRTNKFFADARLPSAERATLEDYRGSSMHRGHNSPAGDMDNEEAMAQSFSLANMMPQAPENNQKAWNGIEQSTRKYAMRARGNVYVITGSISLPGYCPISFHLVSSQKSKGSACTIGNGVVVPSHIYKLVYDVTTQRAWAHWIENADEARVTAPISYQELVRRTGIEFLPGAHPKI